jgi:hypothetical protein
MLVLPHLRRMPPKVRWLLPKHDRKPLACTCLQACGHAPDARLATTLIRVCSQHGQALAALGLYDWMRAGRAAGGGALTPTVFTYTAAMRAALAGGLLPRALQVCSNSHTAQLQ